MPRSYLRFMFNYSVLGQSFGKSWMILMCSWGCELLIQDNQGEHISLASDWLWKKHVPQSWGMEASGRGLPHWLKSETQEEIFCLLLLDIVMAEYDIWIYRNYLESWVELSWPKDQTHMLKMVEGKIEITWVADDKAVSHRISQDWIALP